MYYPPYRVWLTPSLELIANSLANTVVSLKQPYKWEARKKCWRIFFLSLAQGPKALYQDRSVAWTSLSACTWQHALIAKVHFTIQSPQGVGSKLTSSVFASSSFGEGAVNCQEYKQIASLARITSIVGYLTNIFCYLFCLLGTPVLVFDWTLGLWFGSL